MTPGGAPPTSWDPEQYLRFGAERERPFDDLVARVVASSPAAVVDLGCGPGTATARLATRWPGSRVVGIDRSPEMVARAARLARPPALRFVEGDLGAWEPDGPVDVVVANAVLQWVPGHLELLGRLARWLVPGGSLAFQVPGNFDQPSHELLRRLAAEGPWAGRLHGLLREAPVHEPARYLERLGELGLEPDVWETTYLHVLRGPDAVFEWTRGTALRPVVDALGDDAAGFAEAYRSALARAYPADGEGRTVLPFRRIFAVGRRPG